MEEYIDLEFLAGKSREMVEKQIESYRQKHTNSGVVIGVVALFIPFFIKGIDNAYLWLQYISIIPLIILITAVIMLLNVLKSKKLYQFFAIDQFDILVNNDYEDILLFEIGANKASFLDNKIIDEKVSKNYNFGITLTIMSIIISTIILSINIFYHPNKEPLNIKIISNNMAKKETTKQRVIPVVPAASREKLNEGVDKKTTPIPIKSNIKKNANGQN